MYCEPSITRKVLHLIASMLFLVLLALAAKVLGFFDAPHDVELTMAIVFAIWIAVYVILYVVITRIGRHPK